MAVASRLSDQNMRNNDGSSMNISEEQELINKKLNSEQKVQRYINYLR